MSAEFGRFSRGRGGTEPLEESECGELPLEGLAAAVFSFACCVCHAAASLLCMVEASPSCARGAPHLPQNCSTASNLPPHFQHDEVTAEAAPRVVLVPATDRSSDKTATFGRSFSPATSIADRSP